MFENLPQAYDALQTALPLLLNTETAKIATKETIKRIFELIQKKPAAQQALQQLESNPQDMTAQQTITEELKTIFLENPEITKQLLQQAANSISIQKIQQGKGIVNVSSPIESQTVTFN